MEKEILDGGYGAMGNIDMSIFLSTLPSEARKTYEEHLREKDPVKFNEFKEWEKKINTKD